MPSPANRFRSRKNSTSECVATGTAGRCVSPDRISLRILEIAAGDLADHERMDPHLVFVEQAGQRLVADAEMLDPDRSVN